MTISPEYAERLRETEEADVDFLLAQLGINMDSIAARTAVMSFRKKNIQLGAENERLRARLSAGSREDALEAQGTIEQLEKQLAFERKKSEPNFLHAPGSPLWRISMLCEQQELYTKDELVGLIQKVVQDDFCSRAQRIANDMG